MWLHPSALPFRTTLIPQSTDSLIPREEIAYIYWAWGRWHGLRLTDVPVAATLFRTQGKPNLNDCASNPQFGVTIATPIPPSLCQEISGGLNPVHAFNLSAKSELRLALRRPTCCGEQLEYTVNSV